MKKHILFTLCALIALVSNTFAQIQNGDTITIFSDSYYLAVNANNNGIIPVSMSAPTKACLWVVTVNNNNQYSFKSVAASEARKNAGLVCTVRNNAGTLSLAATPSAFQFGTNGLVTTNSNETTGRLYYKTGNQYYYIRYQSQTNGDGTWSTVRKTNAPNAAENGTLLTLEQWTKKVEKGGLVGAFNIDNPEHFVLAKTPDAATQQAQHLTFTVTRQPAETYYSCLPREGKDYSKISIDKTVSNEPIDLRTMSFTWQKTPTGYDRTKSYGQAGTYDDPEAITRRELLSVSYTPVEGAATPTYNVTVTPLGSSPMNMKQDDAWIDHEDVLVAAFGEGDLGTNHVYMNFMRHAYHKIPLPRFMITATPMSYTFSKTGGDTDFQFTCTHQHGYQVVTANESHLAEMDITLQETLQLGKDINTATKTAKASFEILSMTDQTTVNWARLTNFTTNNLTITADANDSQRYREARLVCKVSYTCDAAPIAEEDYNASVEIRLAQRAKEGAMTLRPYKGFANNAFGTHPVSQEPEQLVHTAEHTLYYLPGDEIDLLLPSREFHGYKRWYDYETGGNPVYNAQPSDRTTWSTTPTGDNINNTYGDSYGIYCTSVDTKTPVIKGWTDGKAHIMACDVSNYKDYELLKNEYGGIDTIIEPTLSYRQLWHLRPASEMADKFAALPEGEYLEVHHYTAPTNTNIYLVPNFGHNRTRACYNNYFYYKDASKNIGRISGNAKWYEGARDITPVSYTTKDYVIVNSDNVGTVEYYLKATGVLPGNRDLLIAKFIVNYVDINTHGPLPREIISRQTMTEEYVLLEEINFNDGATSSTINTQLYQHLPWGESTYGYYYPNNYLGGSDKYYQHSNRSDNNIPYYGEYFLVNELNLAWADQTNHGGANNGYTLYVDGTEEPGLVASISTAAEICEGQTLYCSIWLCNPARSSHSGSDPIFRCNIQGRNQTNDGYTEWEDAGVYFVGKLNKGTSSAGGSWHQVVFPINSTASYSETRVSLYNFGTGGDGNDFMVDDICLYVSPLPLAAYQATMGCESFTDASTTSTAVVVRMDYSELNIYSTDETDTNKKKYAYYQIFNNSDDMAIQLTAPVVRAEGDTIYEPAYYKDSIGHSDNLYGSVTIPHPRYVPNATNDTIQTSIRDYIDQLIEKKIRNGKCYIYDNVTGKWFVYVIHIIPNIDHHATEDHVMNSHLEKGKDYELRISHSPGELGDVACASRTPLHATQDTYIKLRTEGEESVRVKCEENLCANDFHLLEVKVQNTLATSVGGSLQTVEANVHADWLWGYYFDDPYCEEKSVTHEEEDFANAQFLLHYGCTRNQLREAIAAMRRIPTNSSPNPNYRVSDHRRLEVNEDFSAEHKALISRLCEDGHLSLYQSELMFYLGSADTARYWVYPIGDDASVNINGETYTLHDCDEPKWVKVVSDFSEYGLNISPIELDKKTPKQRLQLPTVRVAEPKDHHTIEIPIVDILGETQLYSTLHINDSTISFDLRNPIRDVLEFIEITNQSIEIAPTPTDWVAGETYLMRMSFYDSEGHAYIGGDEDNCRVGYVYFYVMIVPNTVQWTGAVSAEWGNDDNWVGVKEDGTLMDIGHAPLAETNVIIPYIEDISIPYPSIGTEDCYPLDIHYAHNACNDIYFAVGAMLHNQHLLHYNRAFVDMKIQAAQWNAMAPPLNGMYTGDIYVPHEGTYNSNPAQTGKSVEYTSLTGTNGHSDYPFVVHEFAGARSYSAPYVFWQSFYNQRATIYHDNGNTSSPALTEEAIFAQTNSLSEQLLPGTGFQVLGFGPSHGEDEDDEIIVRLPKPDNSYNYYDSKGNLSGQSVSVTHSSKLAFNPTNGVMTITLQNDLAGRQFMFGNPTMAYIDMAAFLTDNADKLAPKYYTIDNSTWSAQNLYSIEANGTGLLAPMRSVMLELKAESSDTRSIQLRLSHEHLKVNTPAPAADDQPANIPARHMAASTDEPQGMTIYATTANGQTQCMLFAAPEATDTYLSHEDVLFVSTGVETANILTTPINMYTVSNQVPMMIDVRQNIDTVPMSMLIHPDYRTEKVEFAFYLTMNWDKECYFYDAVTGERVRIMDGTIIERPLPQNHENRYYIVGPDRTSNGENTETAIPSVQDQENMVWAYSEQAGEMTVCSNDIIQSVTIYDITGRLIAHKALDLLYNQVSLPVGQGVHIAEVTLRDNSKHYTRTIVK